MDRRCIGMLAGLFLFGIGVDSVSADRQSISLDGSWQFRRDESGSSWKAVTVPSTFESHESTDFDGIGLYRRELPAIRPAVGQRVMIEFQGVATEATVSVDGDIVGTHLGGWTPFRCDITESLLARTGSGNHRLMVRVDEKVGHNSQGFLPVFAPHFGGIWQSVRLLILPESHIADRHLLVSGDAASGSFQIQLPLAGVEAKTGRLRVRYRANAQASWSNPVSFSELDGTVQTARTLPGHSSGSPRRMLTVRLPVHDWKEWSPAHPVVYDVELTWQATGSNGEATMDRVVVPSAFRTFRTDGHRFLLNGKPVSLRGVLNWGYAPPRVAPTLDSRKIRADLEWTRSMGFNLMKFCLWVPPRTYLNLADRMGILTWVEYPTWHSRWTADQLPTLRREFDEFFFYDRVHPSVVLRSLTCETGPSADLQVIRTLYDRCHQLVPQAVVEDDSSWIGWNRIHDFYDDHPYGNNHTWTATLARLTSHIADRETKPLILGEAIAADTWVDSHHLPASALRDRPFWLPRFLDGNREWLDRMNGIAGSTHEATLMTDSLRYAWLMRKFQIEAYRREVPTGGYVVSVIRDMPLCSMGLIDYNDEPKWAPAEWSWHGETMLLMQTEGDRFSFVDNMPLSADILVSHFGTRAIEDGQLDVSLTENRSTPDQPSVSVQRRVSVPAGKLTPVSSIQFPLPSVSRPTPLKLTASLRANNNRWTNHWTVWVIPGLGEGDRIPAIVHKSCSGELRHALTEVITQQGASDRSTAPIIAARFDGELLDLLEAGAHVLLLPDGSNGSLPLSQEWFLKGGPWVASDRLPTEIPREFLIDLQSFDLAGSVIPDIQYLDQIDPLFLLWHNHDLDRVKSQGLLFETRLGTGRLLVSALRHTGTTNSAGKWLLKTLLDQLQKGDPPVHALRPETVLAMRGKLDEQIIDLTGKTWQFRPDPDNRGMEQGWERARLSEPKGWKPIRIGTAWEGAGYPTLDGWAWYRIDVAIPSDWHGRKTYLSIAGADDYYELYVEGQLVGSGGNIEKRRTAFEMRQSHDITAHIRAGSTISIAARLYDWQGAGGLFRPVWISTQPIGTGVNILASASSN